MYSVANQNSYTVFPNQEKNVPNSDMDPTFQHLKRNIKTKLQQNIKKPCLTTNQWSDPDTPPKSGLRTDSDPHNTGGWKAYR